MGTRILVVDDEPAICRMVGAVLNTIGFETESITDSTMAEMVLRAEKFDAVFIDARMPEPSGVELVRRLRQHGYNQNTPVVMMTGDTEPALLAQAFEAGTNYFLFKPVDRRKLERILRASQFAVDREKRRYQRICVHLDVQVECKHQRLQGRTIDLSMGGVLLEVNDVFPLGSAVRIDVRLCPNAPTFRASGRVVRLLEINRMGIQFDPLDSAETERLQEFLLPYFIQQPETEELERPASACGARA